jgi:hypothetical protein
LSLPNFEADMVSNNAERPSYSAAPQRLIQELVRSLSHIDGEYNLRMSSLERSSTDDDLKPHIAQRLRAAHRERREPYVKQLEALRAR